MPEEKLSEDEFEDMLEAMQQPSISPVTYALSALIIVGLPIGVIFALNAIFGMGVDYNLLNWVAIEILLIATNNKYTLL